MYIGYSSSTGRRLCHRWPHFPQIVSSFLVKSQIKQSRVFSIYTVVAFLENSRLWGKSTLHLCANGVLGWESYKKLFSPCEHQVRHLRYTATRGQFFISRYSPHTQEVHHLQLNASPEFWSCAPSPGIVIIEEKRSHKIPDDPQGWCCPKDAHCVGQLI